MTRPSRLGIGFALLLAACAPTPVVEEPVEAPRLPLRTMDGADHYRVDPEASLVHARVFRGGRLAKLGHNHVVVFEDVRGDVFLAEPIGDSLFDLVVLLRRVTVDPPELRARQGDEFRSEISDDARSQTRGNMLGSEVLDASKYPYATISSSSITGPAARPRVTMSVDLKGVRHRMTIPVSLELEGGRLRASGRFEVLQSDFGIEPFAVLGGALKVEDRVELIFRLVAGPAN